MKTNWSDFVIWDNNNIRGFYGRDHYFWLSNFYPCEVYVGGIRYPSSENAYQAAKVKKAHRIEFTDVSACESKRLWKEFPLVDASAEEWDARKITEMTFVVGCKFFQNRDLAYRLIDTGDKYLEELNSHGDTFWGVDYKTGKGENHLGEILMTIRGALKVMEEEK